MSKIFNLKTEITHEDGTTITSEGNIANEDIQIFLDMVNHFHEISMFRTSKDILKGADYWKKKNLKTENAKGKRID